MNFKVGARGARQRCATALKMWILDGHSNSELVWVWSGNRGHLGSAHRGVCIHSGIRSKGVGRLEECGGEGGYPKRSDCRKALPALGWRCRGDSGPV